MSTTVPTPDLQEVAVGDPIQYQIGEIIDQLIAELPNPQQLTSEQRRGILARYTAVLEGNFIYWMTATYLAVKTEDARPTLLDNLHEEVSESHPVMLRRFAIAANAFPTDTDALAVDADLTNVRLFLGKLQGVPSLVTMAFFEAWIQRFMAYLASLAAAQGSKEFVYTDVHGVCDIAHSQGLFHAVSVEMANYPVDSDVDLFEGVTLLRKLIHTIMEGPVAKVH
jgi:hypothetical protein